MENISGEVILSGQFLSEALPIRAEKFRTTREKFYLLLVIIGSLVVWGWLFYSVYKQFSPSPSPSLSAAITPKVGETYRPCVIRDNLDGQIKEIHEGYLPQNNHCLDERHLTPEDRATLEAERQRWASEPEPCYARNSYVGYDNIGRIGRYQLSVEEYCLTQTELAGYECFVSGPRNMVRKIELSELDIGYFCLPTQNLTPEQMSEAREAYNKGIDPFDLPARSVSQEQEGVARISEVFTTPILVLLFFTLGLFFHLLAMAHIRLNGIKVGPDQFPELYEGVKELSSRLGMKKQPDMFIINGDGLLNAFAARLVIRKILVLYSDLAEVLLEDQKQGQGGVGQRQLEAVLSHELGHHALGHTSIWNWFIQPGMSIPFLGHAYSRAREYSCDAIMNVLISDEEACRRALVKLAGGALGWRVNVPAYLKQVKEEGGFFAWLAEKLSTHPHLPKRIEAIRTLP